MDAGEHQPEDPTGGKARDGGWFGRRKRVVSHEVSSGPVTERHLEVRDEVIEAARGTLRPADIIDIPSLPAGPPSEAVLDPTLFLQRTRRRGANLAYRITQLVTLVAPLSASASLAFAFTGHRLRAMVLAAAACLLSGISVWLVRRSSLARRLRGYAAAACVLAVIALALSFLKW